VIPPWDRHSACFTNYGPAFKEIGRAGDIVISDRNFGTGSSREQAATALQKRGIQCVIAYSFRETYKRNAFNNGFVVFECPAFVEYLAEKFGGPGTSSSGAKPQASTIVGPEIEIDYQRSLVTCDGREYQFPPLRTVAHLKAKTH
jgi:homoaconitate hydratase